VVCHVDELRPHHSYVRNHLTVSASQFSALVDLGDLAFREPITITPDRTILDRYGRVKLARSKGRATLLCLVCKLGETETLQHLLQKHHRSTAWNAFSRTLLALDLEPGLVVKARSNQCAGGQNKGSSNLTEVAPGGCPVQNCRCRRCVCREREQGQASEDDGATGTHAGPTQRRD